MIRQFIEKIAKVLAGLEVEKAAGQPNRGSAPTQTPGRAGEPTDEFDKRVRAMAAGRPNPSARLATGAVQLVGMDEIRAELGDAWQGMAEKARGVAERAIRQHLTDVDIYTQGDDDTYILFFAELPKIQAERKTRAIVEQIRAELLRDVPEAEELHVGFQVAELDPEQAFDSNMSVLDAVMASLDAVKQETEEAYERQRRQLLGKASIVFSPTWQPASQSVVMYRCGLDRQSGEATLANLKLMTDALTLQSAIADIDYFIMGRAIATLHAALQRNAKTALLIPIHYQTLNDRKRQQGYLSLCQKIPASYAKFVLFEVSDIPDETPISRVVEAARTVKPFVNALILSIPFERERALFEIGTRGIYGVALSMNDFEHSSASQSRLAKYAADAKAAGIRTFVHDADELAAARAAVVVGVDFIDGEAVAARADAPKGAYRWRPIDM